MRQNGMAPLHYAAWQGSVDGVELLLDHGAKVNAADAVSRRRALSHQCMWALMCRVQLLLGR